MKPIALVIAPFAAAVPAGLLAQDSGVTVDATFATKYVDRGIQYGDDTWHPTVELYSDDFYAGVWAALPLENRGYPEYYDDEYDFYAGYGWALNNDTALDLGATYYHFPNDGEDSLEAYLGLSREFGTFTPSFYIYKDFDLETLTYRLGTDFALPLKAVPFEMSVYVGRVEADEDDSYNYYGADVLYPIVLNDATSISLGLHFADHDLGMELPDSHLYGTASFTVDF